MIIKNQQANIKEQIILVFIVFIIFWVGTYFKVYYKDKSLQQDYLNENANIMNSLKSEPEKKAFQDYLSCLSATELKTVWYLIPEFPETKHFVCKPATIFQIKEKYPEFIENISNSIDNYRIKSIDRIKFMKNKL